MARNGTMEAFEDRFESLKESVRNLVDVGSSKMGGAARSVIATSKTGMRRAGELVKDHPFIAIGIAFGLGFVTMRLLRR
ncbi:MAG TPA: hypothetical protein VMJ10_28145 [Kofleriaceae bacterium]|nr:hypothetical protein [Kofleriaceae bacterium]